jgi:hypothetical protein
MDEGTFEKLNRKGVFKRLCQVPSQKGYGEVCVWRLAPWAAERVDHYDGQPSDDALPCGHVGFTNIGEYLQCNECNGRWTKTEIREQR